MGPKSIFRTDLVSIALLVVSLGISAAPPAASQGLGGEERDVFKKHIAEGCIKNGDADPGLTELPEAKLRSVCLCASAYFVAHATPAQLDKPDTQAVRALVAKAIRACFTGKQPA